MCCGSTQPLQVHDGKVTDYTGSSVGASCCVKVSLDLVRQVRQGWHDQREERGGNVDN